MTQTKDPKRDDPQRGWAIATVGVFFVLLVLPVAVWTLGIDEGELLELGGSMERPDWPKRLDQIEPTFRSLDRYANESFGLRVPLVRTHYRLMAMLGSGSDEVIRGKNGWLFVDVDGSLDRFRGLRMLTPAAIEHIAETTRARSE